MAEARNRGGNAIIGMRFDTTELGDVWTEICAYGTAVQAVPVTDAAKYTAQQLGYGGPPARPASGCPARAAPALWRPLEVSLTMRSSWP